MTPTATLTIAFLGGLLPALLWLWFWRKEDGKHPEPKRFIALAFGAGMLAVPLVIPLQEQSQLLLAGFGTAAVMAVWAVLEEVMKFALVGIAVLGRKVVDEPVDVVIYLISAALGFAALENVLFLANVYDTKGAVVSILTGNLRFLGAMLLHILASATVGAALALTFYRGWLMRIAVGLIGLILASALHAAFNLSIIATNGQQLFPIFLGVWTGIIVLILVFEKIKRIKRTQPMIRRQ